MSSERRSWIRRRRRSKKRATLARTSWATCADPTPTCAAVLYSTPCCEGSDTMLSPASLRLTAARHALHLASGEELIRCADALLERGVYTYSLGKLWSA